MDCLPSAYFFALSSGWTLTPSGYCSHVGCFLCLKTHWECSWFKSSCALPSACNTLPLDLHRNAYFSPGLSSSVTPRAFLLLPVTQLLHVTLSHSIFFIAHVSIWNYSLLLCLPPSSINALRAGSYVSCSLSRRVPATRRCSVYIYWLTFFFFSFYFINELM